MKFRPAQLVCLALLLGTLRLADPAALAPAEFALRAGYLQALLSSAPARAKFEAPRARRTSAIPAPAALLLSSTQAPHSPPAHLLRAIWTMLPPASQSAALQSVTGFGRPA